MGGSDRGALLCDPWLWGSALVLGLAGAVVGVWFGPSIGETAAVGAVALGLIGLVPGFILGIGIALQRRLARARLLQQEAAAAARERFVALLNSKAGGEPLHAIDPRDPRVLVMDWTRHDAPDLTPEVVERLRAAIEAGSIEFAAAASEVRAHGFAKFAFRINGTTIVERPV